MRRFILIKLNLWAWQIWNFPKSDKLTQNLKHPQTPFSLTQFHSCQNITFDHSRRHCQRPNESFIIVLGIFTNFPPLFCAQWKFFVLNCHHQEKNSCRWDGKQWISEFHIKICCHYKNDSAECHRLTLRNSFPMKFVWQHSRNLWQVRSINK